MQIIKPGLRFIEEKKEFEFNADLIEEDERIG